MGGARFWIAGLGLACLVTVLPAGQPASAQQMAPELPGKARDLLKKQWETWSVAPIDQAVSGCAADASPVVQFDVDGDGGADYIAAISTPDGVHLVVLLSRLWGYNFHDLDSLGESTAMGYVVATPRGTAFVNPATGAEDYLTTETVTVKRCGTSQSDFYRWLGYRFEKVTVTPS